MNSQSELRQDPVCGRWTAIAPERSHRPQNLAGAEPASRYRNSFERSPCPFCPGQECDTPNEVLAYRDPGSAADGPGWQLRVVPNKFPALRSDGFDLPGSGTDPHLRKISGYGRAEVVIECPEHLPDPTRLSDGQFEALFRSYRDRILTLSQEPRLAYAAVFKNVGAEAGASLGHTHSQIIATPFIPGSIETELAGTAAYHARSGTCLFCELHRREMLDGARFVVRSANFAVFTAFAPRFDYEFWVLPCHHESRFETISDAGCQEVAQLMKHVLVGLDRAAHEPAYNWFLHTSPLRSPPLPHYHWHIEVLPRTARPAGLEWGFGCCIVSLSPETAARRLRHALPIPH